MSNRGFTLIELLVSVTIFIVVMVIALGALLSISAAERKAESFKTVMNNLHFALDSMSRSIRTGTVYHCPAGASALIDEPVDCIDGDDYFAFEPFGGNPSDDSDQVVYYHEPDPEDCGPNSVGGCIRVSKNGETTFSTLTSPEVDITDLTFYVIGAEAEFENDIFHSQPKVIITISGQVVLGASQTTQFNLQTSVTQRLYDL